MKCSACSQLDRDKLQSELSAVPGHRSMILNSRSSARGRVVVDATVVHELNHHRRRCASCLSSAADGQRTDAHAVYRRVRARYASLGFEFPAVLYFSTSTYWQCRFMFVLGGVISIFSYIYSATVLYFRTTTYRHCSTTQMLLHTPWGNTRILHTCIRRGVVLSGP